MLSITLVRYWVFKQQTAFSTLARYWPVFRIGHSQVFVLPIWATPLVYNAFFNHRNSLERDDSHKLFSLLQSFSFEPENQFNQLSLGVFINSTCGALFDYFSLPTRFPVPQRLVILYAGFLKHATRRAPFSLKTPPQIHSNKGVSPSKQRVKFSQKYFEKLF